MALGPTHYVWRPDVERLVMRVSSEFPRLRANTYKDHPWPGWDGVSVDWWGSGGRGDNIGERTGWRLLSHLLGRADLPPLRHWIFEHALWTSFGGKQLWVPPDHTGRLRHLHMTFWR